MAKPIFYDPKRKRWKRLRLVLDVVGLVTTILVVAFIITVFRGVSMGNLLLPEQRRPYRALKEKEKPRPKARSSRRKTQKPATELVLNSGEGVRAAFYVTWDAASYASLREYYPQIDLLYPEWLHVLTSDGHLQGLTPENKLVNVVQHGIVQPADDKVMPFLKSVNAETEVLPLVNNFDPTRNQWINGIDGFLNSPVARANFRQQAAAF